MKYHLSVHSIGFWMIWIRCSLCCTIVLKATDTTEVLRSVSFEFYNYRIINCLWFRFLATKTFIIFPEFLFRAFRSLHTRTEEPRNMRGDTRKSLFSIWWSLLQVQEEKPSGQSLSVLCEANCKENQAVGKENQANTQACTSCGQRKCHQWPLSSIYTLHSPEDNKH